MDVPKRASFTIPKINVRCNGKLKEILSSSKTKSEAQDLSNIPFIKQNDSVRLLPKYSAILAKSADDGVCMEDLDLLQQDLEKLYSTSAIRIRFFLSEIGEVDRNDDGPERKAYDKTSLIRKRPDEKPKFKDVKNGMRVKKRNLGFPANFIGDSLQEVPKVTLPKNDNSDKFWASIEPFCSSVTKDDIASLDSLIQEFSNEIDIEIPEVGDHYANGWSEEIINDEQNLGKSPSKKGAPTSDIKKDGLHAMLETFSSPHTQRLLNNLHKNGENEPEHNKLKQTEFTKLRSSNAGHKVGRCLDRRLKKELMEQGIITMEDLAKNVPEDEILNEITKCQQELATVNEYNLGELNKLKKIVMNDLRSSEMKEQLERVDKQVLELYKKIIVARKTAQQVEGDDFDKVVFTEQVTKDFEGQADALLKEQIELNREINGLTEMDMIY